LSNLTPEVLSSRRARYSDDSAERERLLAFYRGWQRALRHRRTPAWLNDASFRDATLGIIAVSFLFLAPLDESLWPRSPLAGLFPWRQITPPGFLTASVVLGVYLVNTFVLCRFLGQSTREPGRYRPWVLALLGLAGGVPLLGFYAVPAWRWVQEVNPAWARRREPREAKLILSPRFETAVPAFAGRATHRPGSIWILIWLFVGSIAALLMAALWMAKRLAGNPAGHNGILTFSLTLHLLGFAILAVYLDQQAVRAVASPGQYVLLCTLSLGYLIPLPYVPLLGVVPLLALEPVTARSHTLIWQALVRRKAVGGLPLWLGMEDALRNGWDKFSWRERLWSPPKSVDRVRAAPLDRTQAQILKLYDLKTFGLAFDAAALAYAMGWLAVRQPRWAAVLPTAHAACLYLTIVLCAAFLALALLHTGWVLLRLPGPLRRLDRLPYAPYVAKTQLALLAGLYLGLELQRGSTWEIGILAMYSCALLASLKAFTLVLRAVSPSPRTLRDEVSTLALLFVLMPVTGLGGALGLLPSLLAAWVLTTPLTGLLLASRLLPWLLRPFAWSDVFRRDLPGRLRLELAVLVLATLAPFGGMAIPACIWIRQRKLPEAQALQFEGLEK
jgi:hypothetical protein